MEYACFIISGFKFIKNKEQLPAKAYYSTALTKEPVLIYVLRVFIWDYPRIPHVVFCWIQWFLESDVQKEEKKKKTEGGRTKRLHVLHL